MNIIFTSVEAGIIYGLMVLGVYLTFRILDFPDLTVDGSFVTGAATSAVLIINGVHPILATLASVVVGFLAGTLTGLLHTKGKINALLSGILVMIALYSINLRIMGKSLISLFNETTIFTMTTNFFESLSIDQTLNQWFPFFQAKTWSVLFIMTVVLIVIKKLFDWFLSTEIGLAIRAVGSNESMIKSFSGNTDRFKILALGISNALVALSGSFIAQYNGFSDMGMGTGLIVIGLASVIIGESIFGTKNIIRTTLAVIGGSIVYRLIVGLALRVEFLETGDLKLITAIIVIVALVTPKMLQARRERVAKKQRFFEKMKINQEVSHATNKESIQSI